MRDASAAASTQPSGSPMERAVAFLARLRVPIGFAAGAVVLWLAQPNRSTLVGGTVVASLGEAVRIWAAGHLRKSLEVTTSGPYRWSAHPLYVGSGVMAAGLAIACGSVAAALCIAFYVGVMLTVAAKSEEASLRRTFGDRYDRYRRGGTIGDESARRFSLAQAVANREYRAILGLIVAVLLLALKAASGV
jgi:protein-S-isoprenylcysteine O-methyltransferase Ste14